MSDSRFMLLSIVAGWVIAAFCAPLFFRTMTFSAPAWAEVAASQTCLGCGLLMAVLIPLYRLLCGQWWSRRLCVLLTAVMTLMCVGIELNMAHYCNAANSWTAPAMAAGSDCAREYSQALLAMHGKTQEMMGNNGYALIAGGLMRLTGSTSLLLPLLLNIFCMTSAALLSGAVCRRLLPRHDGVKMLFWGTLLCAAIPSIPYYGTIMMKEAVVCLGTMLMTLALAEAYMGRRRLRAILAGAAGALILMLVKSPVGWLMMAGVVCTVVHLWLTHRRRPASMAMPLYMVLLSVAVVAGGRQFRAVSDTEMISPANQDDREVLSHNFLDEQAVGSYSSVIGDYYFRSQAERIAWLPVASVTQYLPPFPWNFTRDTYIAPTVVWAHLAFLWYIIGGMVCCWYALCSWRKQASGGLGMWGVWWAVCYLGIAYMSGGTVARYWLPFAGAAIPLAISLVSAFRSGAVSKRSLTVCGGVYLLLLLGALTSAFIFFKL